MPPDAAFGPLSTHMLQHIVLMNLVAPLVAVSVRRRLPAGLARWWAAATLFQLVLFWAWHAPPALRVAMDSPAVMLAMHTSLAAAAFWFWAGIVAISGDSRWRALFALLVTGKLFCLLAVLFVFAPRYLYGTATAAAEPAISGGGLADQQLAGLLMLVACPLSYVLAGIVIAARWLRDLERADDARERPVT